MTLLELFDSKILNLFFTTDILNRQIFKYATIGDLVHLIIIIPLTYILVWCLVILPFRFFKLILPKGVKKR